MLSWDDEEFGDELDAEMEETVPIEFLDGPA